MKNDKIIITDKFWKKYRNLVRTEMIPYQWNVLNDKININIERERNDASIPNEKSHAIANFKIAAGLEKGNHYGWVFQDSDVYKWLEAVAYSLAEEEDDHLRALADGVVDLIEQAQEEDGYLGTYFTIKAPDRKFKRLSESHELYCAGHFIEAAVAYYEATQNEKVLDIARKLADCIDAYFGAEKEKRFGFDGHEEIEIALMRLYHLTGETRYMDLSKYFLTIRGTDSEFFKKQKEEDPEDTPLIPGFDNLPPSYCQIHKPLIEQDTAEGHAVRLVYMCTAMAYAAAATDDKDLLSACKKIWRNIVDRRMYITGGIGSTVIGESFTYDYDLPNDTMYCETCASVGLIFFARQMLQNESIGEYGDVLERALYNTVISGMALDGKHFFYVNPLEASPEASEKDPGKSHVKIVRPEWLGCACCPPNLARLITSLDKYVYVQKGNTILSNLFMDNDSSFKIGNGKLNLKQTTNYPWNGDVQYELNCSGEEVVALGIRIPGWCDQYSISLNGSPISPKVVNNFAYIERNFKNDIITFELEIKVEKWCAHPFVKHDTGKVAITRGPLVYCLESIDNETNLFRYFLNNKTVFKHIQKKTELGDIVILECDGYVTASDYNVQEPLYKKYSPPHMIAKKLTWIPYYCWANRGKNEMQVWIRQESK